MQSLRYTNLLLTIISVCLVYQCIKFDSVPSAAASKQAGGVLQVRVLGTVPVTVQNTVATRASGLTDVNISGVYGYSWKDTAQESQKGTIRVAVGNPSLMTYNLTPAPTVSFPDTIDVNVADSSVTSPVGVAVEDWNALDKVKIHVDEWDVLLPMAVSAQ